ncbi:MAG: bifunctional hydroxymethylpyrimidine kinase/phosphomethylpyrimidine kinase [Thermodesulfovibrio sp.]|nr:bifunctional hydroxymethylpyrimidine kinase/phosphomethylpyrimidine kinase [Thermodesulfovibrio sp.]
MRCHLLTIVPPFYNSPMRMALTIAGFDPSGGAGIQADLKVFSGFEVYGLSVVAALTAQNSMGVKAVRPVASAFLRRQLTVLFEDLEPHALKTGMLQSRANVAVVSEIIKKYRLGNVVVDPVLLSSTGRRLAEKGTEALVRNKLLPVATVVTPNMHEASVLAGIEVKDLEDMKRAAVILHELGAESVIVTGGHLEGTAVDIFYNGEYTLLKGRKVPGEFHGTGCRFSAVIAALLAKGVKPLAAAQQAKIYMRQAMKKTFSTGKGMHLFNV